MIRPSYTREDFDHSPLLVFYETTQACDLACVHCRADAQKTCHPDELSTLQAKAMIDQLATFPKPPLLVLTGGDPIKRADVFALIDHASSRGLKVAMTPSATPLMNADVVKRLKESNLDRLAVSLDGATAQTHDGFRRVAGSYQKTLDIIAYANAVGLPVQINTTIGRHNVAELETIAELLAQSQIELWSIFFIVPTGRATMDQRLIADEVEEVFGRIHALSKRMPYAIKTTEAPHYRRYVLQQQKGAAKPKATPPAATMVGTNDGKGVLFVSHTGEIFPSGFMPISAGRFPFDHIVRVYQQSKIFRALRDPDQLQGKCGQCEYKTLCGGSRARAHALAGNPLAEEPDCAYQPAKRSAREASMAACS